MKTPALLLCTACLLLSASCSREIRYPVIINMDNAVENNDPVLYQALRQELPPGIAVSEHYIAAYDSQSGTLDLYDKDGNFLHPMARRGLDTGTFDALYSIKTDERRRILYILDWGRLHSYTLSGNYIGTLPLGAEEPDGFAVAENGTILVHHGRSDAKVRYALYDTLGNSPYTHPNPAPFFDPEFNSSFTTDFSDYLFEGYAHVKDRNDTLFRVRADSLTPRFVFTGVRALASSKNAGAKEYGQAYRMAGMAETPDYLVFETEQLGHEPAKRWSYHKQARTLHYTQSAEKPPVSLPALKKAPAPRSTSVIPTKDFTEQINGVPFKMIAVPEGSYERPNHPDPGFSPQARYVNEASTVHIDSYYMAETEVTQALWKAVTGAYHSSFDKNGQMPVNNVSWISAIQFIRKLNALTGKAFRLPTEAEWEYAAGGARPRLTKWAGTDNVHKLSAYACFIDGNGTQAPVKSKLPNRLGLYDMTGNVYEWCMDWYADYPDEKTATNPQGGITGRAKVFKGWAFTKENEERPHITSRKYLPLHMANYTNGFRIAMSAQ